MPYTHVKDRRAASKRHYLTHKVKMKRRTYLFTLKARARNRKFVRDYLAAHPCVDCGEGDPVVLDFDHVRGIKIATISSMLSNAVGLEKLKKEVKKCDVRCANCHRRVTRKRELKK